MKRKKVKIMLVILCVASLAAFAVIRFKKPSIATETFYTNQEPYIGGLCEHVVYKDNSTSAKPLEPTICIDSPVIGLLTDDLEKLIKIKAVVEKTKEKRTPSTPTPQYETVEVWKVKEFLYD